MIPIPEHRQRCIISVRREDYRQFVEDCLCDPRTEDYFVIQTYDTPEKVLKPNAPCCEDRVFRNSDTAYFYFDDMEQVMKWTPMMWASEVRLRICYGDPIPYNPKPLFLDNDLFGGDG